MKNEKEKDSLSYYQKMTPEQKAIRKAQMNEYNKKNRKKLTEYQKSYRKTKGTSEKTPKPKITTCLYQRMTPEQKAFRNKQMLEYNNSNREKLKEYRRNYCNDRMKNDELFRLKNILKNTLRMALRNERGYTKKSILYTIIGLPWSDFKIYFEGQFYGEMQWSDPKGWEIQHIIPLSSAKSEEELKSLFLWTNIIPLTREDNKKAWK